MKINNLFLKLALPVVALVAACNPVVEVEPELTLEKDTYTVAQEGGEVTVNLHSNVAWSASVDGEFEDVMLEPESGKASADAIEVRITLGVNESGDERVVKVDFEDATAVVKKTVTISQAGKKQEIPEGPEAISIAEFLEKDVDETVYYQLTGRIGNILNLDYSNFYIEDVDNPEISVYIYGLAYESDIANQRVSLLLNEGVEVGDIITIAATRGAFGDFIEGMKSYYISHEDVEEPVIKLGTTSIRVVSGNAFRLVVNSNHVSWTLSSDVDWISLDPSSGDASTYVIGTVSEAGTDETGVITLSAEGLEDQTCTVTRSVNYTTLAEITEEGTYTVKEAVVMVQLGNRIVLNDGTADFFAYGNASDVKVGDVVTLSGNVISYDGILEFSQPVMTITGEKEVVYPENPKEFDEAAFEAYAADPALEYIKGNATLKGGKAFCGAQELSLVSSVELPENGTVEYCGYAVGYNDTFSYTVVLGTKVEITSEEPEVPEIEAISIAEFLEKPVNDAVYYQLTGKIISVVNDYYSNFYIQDLNNPEVSVYIYGLAYKENIANQGVRLLVNEYIDEGDVITIASTRGEYAGVIEGLKSYYISHVKTETPVTRLALDEKEILAGSDFNLQVRSNLASWTLSSDVDWLTFTPSAGDRSTSVKVSVSKEGEGTTGVLTLSAEGTEPKTCTVTRIIPVEYVTFAEITEEGTYDVENALVVAKFVNHIILNDGTADFFAYGNASDVKVGDVVTLNGNVIFYDGILEFSQPMMTVTGEKEVVYPEPAEYDEAALKAYASAPKLEFIKVNVRKEGKVVSCGEQLLRLFYAGTLPEGYSDLWAYALGYNEQYNNISLQVVKHEQTSSFIEATITAGDVTVNAGETVELGASTNSTAALHYVSQNPEIATVDADGIVSGVAEGEAHITISVESDGNYTAASVDVKVTVLSGEVAPEIGTLKDIKAIVAAGTGTDRQSFSYEISNAVVTYVNGLNAFIEDETAGLLVYKSGHGYNAGDVLSGVFEGAGYAYSGLAEVTDITTAPAVTPGEVPAPKAVTLAEILADFDAYDSRLVVVEGISITDGLASGDRNGRAAQDDKDIALYAKINGVTIATGTYGDLVCIPGVNNGNKQLTVWETGHFTEKVSTVPVSGVSLDRTALNLKVGGSAILTATVSPAGAANKNVSWSSSNEAVATIADGKVVAVGAGEATITVTTEDGGYTASCVVTVTEKEGEAEEDKIYTLQFGAAYNSQKIGSYTNSWTVTCDDFTWNMTNWNNNNNSWNYVKAGSKNAASVASIETSKAMPYSISAVTMTIDKVTAASINSIKLEVLLDGEVVETIDGVIAQGDCTFYISSPAKDRTYRIVVDCAKASANGPIQVSKVTYKNN